MIHLRILTIAGLIALAGGSAAALELHTTAFPEGRTVNLRMERSPGAPEGRIQTRVTHREGQSRIEIEYEQMKPAILYAGDVTCYVLWAVSRDGHAENLGEFLVNAPKDKLEFATGKKAFALLVTAEPFYLIGQPSDLVAYYNAPATDKRASSSAFEFKGLGPSPGPALQSITNISWDAKIPLELLQARKAFELATHRDAAVHAQSIYREAEQALEEANALERKSPGNRKLLDSARRSVALSNEALNIAARRKEGIEIEKQIATRRAEMQALEQRAAEAETEAREAADMVAAAREDMERLRKERERMAEQTAALREETRRLESGMEVLRREKQSLEQTKTRLQDEKSVLSQRLSGALSHVAETKNSARGYVVNLPDILFEVNEAVLKPEARQVLAKLAGILLVMPDLRVAIEGHTDSTGGEEYNLELSQHRADAVLGFLSQEGIDASALRAVGHGMARPVADNATAEGRKKNRRVEIVISES